MTISETTLMSIRQAYQIWAENQGDDVTSLLNLMAEDVEVTTLPDGTDPLSFTKACRGKAEMTEYFHALVGDWQLLKADIDDMVHQHDLVVVVLDTAWRNRRTDISFASQAAHVWRFRDGFACQIRLFFDSAKWSQAACPD